MLEKLKKIREKIADFPDDLEAWGAYASEYFQEKWDLKGNVNQAKEVLALLDTLIANEEKNAGN